MAKKKKMKTRVIGLSVEKGGVAKTTTAVNIADILASNGRTVLLVDMDHQGNAGICFGIEEEDVVEKNISQVISGELELKDVVIEIKDNLYLAPSCYELKEAIAKLQHGKAREDRLKNALKTINNVDYIIIDAPTGEGLVIDNVYFAATEIIAPVQMEALSVKGFKNLLSTVDSYREFNPEIDISGILLTMFNGHLNQTKKLLNELKKSEKIWKHVFTTTIPRNVSLSEAQGTGLPVSRYAPSSTGSKAYISFCKELMKMEEYND